MAGTAHQTTETPAILPIRGTIGHEHPLMGWDGYEPCPYCMGTSAHLCEQRVIHDDSCGRVRVACCRVTN